MNNHLHERITVGTLLTWFITCGLGPLLPAWEVTSWWFLLRLVITATCLAVVIVGLAWLLNIRWANRRLAAQRAQASVRRFPAPVDPYKEP